MTFAWLLAVAGAALLVVGPGFSDPYQSPRLAVLALLALPLLARRSRFKSGLELPMLVALTCWLVSALSAGDFNASFVGVRITPFDCWTAVLCYNFLALGVARLGTTPRAGAEAVCWASLPLSAYAVAQRAYSAYDPILPDALAGLRVVATQGSPVYLGAVLALVVACAAALLFDQEYELNARRQGLVAATLALALPALWFTGTRGALLGAAAAVAVLLPRRARWGLLALAPLMLLHPRAHAVMSDLGRMEVWRISWRIFLAHPWLGVGPGNFPIAFRAFVTPTYVAIQHNALMQAPHAHNQLLHVAATTGLLGLLGYACVAGPLALACRFSDSRRILLPVGAAYVVVAALNPTSHAALVVLLLVFAPAFTLEQAEERGAEWGLLPGACAAAAIACCVAASDWHHMRAIKLARVDSWKMTAELQQAAALNPWEIRLQIDALEARAMVAAHAPRAQGLPLMRACVEDAAALAADRPGESYAHESYGRLLLLSLMMGNPGDPQLAAAAFERAQALAPTFVPIMRRRFALARALHDLDGARRAEADLQRMNALTSAGV